jgi:hypothetical protein
MRKFKQVKRKEVIFDLSEWNEVESRAIRLSVVNTFLSKHLNSNGLSDVKHWVRIIPKKVLYQEFAGVMLVRTLLFQVNLHLFVMIISKQLMMFHSLHGTEGNSKESVTSLLLTYLKMIWMFTNCQHSLLL